MSDLIARLRVFADELDKYQDTYQSEMVLLREAVVALKQVERERDEARERLLAIAGHSNEYYNGAKRQHASWSCICDKCKQWRFDECKQWRSLIGAERQPDAVRAFQALRKIADALGNPMAGQEEG